MLALWADRIVSQTPVLPTPREVLSAPMAATIAGMRCENTRSHFLEAVVVESIQLIQDRPP